MIPERAKTNTNTEQPCKVLGQSNARRFHSHSGFPSKPYGVSSHSETKQLGSPTNQKVHTEYSTKREAAILVEPV